MTEERRGPGRPRKEAEKAERRRRDVSTLEHRKERRLHLDESQLDRENYEYRWANDRDNRLHKLHGEDWDVVPDRDSSLRDSDDMGSAVAVNAGTKKDGDTLRTVLLRKPKKLFNDDFAAAQRRIDALDAAIQGGTVDKGYDYSPDERGARIRVET